MADGTVYLSFQSDLPERIPQLVSSLRQLTGEFQRAASETESLSLLPGIDESAGEALRLIGEELPRVVNKARTALAGGLLDKSTFAQLTGDINGLLRAVDEVSAAGSRAGLHLVDRNTIRDLQTTVALLGEVKVLLREVGGSPSQVGQVTRLQTATNQRVGTAAGELGVSPAALKELERVIEGEVISSRTEIAATEDLTRAKRDAARRLRETSRKEAEFSDQQQAERRRQQPTGSTTSGFSDPQTGQPTPRAGTAAPAFSQPTESQPPGPRASGPAPGGFPSAPGVSPAQSTAAARIAEQAVDAAAQAVAPRLITLYRGETGVNSMPGAAGGASGRFYTTDFDRAVDNADLSNLAGTLKTLKVTEEQLAKLLGNRENTANARSNSGYKPGDVIVGKQLAGQATTANDLEGEARQAALNQLYEQTRELNRQPASLYQGATGLISSSFAGEQAGLSPETVDEHYAADQKLAEERQAAEKAARIAAQADTEQTQRTTAEKKTQRARSKKAVDDNTTAVEQDTAETKQDTAAKRTRRSSKKPDPASPLSLKDQEELADFVEQLGRPDDADRLRGVGGGGAGGGGGSGSGRRGAFSDDDDEQDPFGPERTVAQQRKIDEAQARYDQFASKPDDFLSSRQFNIDQAVGEVRDPSKAAFRTPGGGDFGGGVFGFPDFAPPGQSPFFEFVKGLEEVPDFFYRITNPNSLQRLAGITPPGLAQGDGAFGRDTAEEFLARYRPDVTNTRFQGAQQDLDLQYEDGTRVSRGGDRLDQRLGGQSIEAQLQDADRFFRHLADGIGEIEKQPRYGAGNPGVPRNDGLPGFEGVETPANRRLGANFAQQDGALKVVTSGPNGELGLRDPQTAEELYRARQALLDQVLRDEASVARTQRADTRTAEQAERRARQEAGGAGRASGGGGGGHGGGGGGGEGGNNGFFGGLLGGAFGSGYNGNATFNPRQAVSNLGGTLGVVARYSTEYQAFFLLSQGVKQVFAQTNALAEAMIHYHGTVEAVNVAHVDLNAAFAEGARFGLSEAESIELGAEGLKAYADEIRAGADSSAVFTDSVKQAGVAAYITGQQALVAQSQLIALTKQFNLGEGGQEGINDSLLAASKRYNTPAAQIAQGAIQAGDLAGVGGFTSDELINLVGAVNQETGRQSASQIARELSEGGSTQYRSGLSQLGITYDPANLVGTLEKAGEAYAGLSRAEQTNFAISLGGQRTAETTVAILKTIGDVTRNTEESYHEGGKAVQEYEEHQKTLGGQLQSLGGIAKQLAADLGKSGLVDFFGLFFRAIVPTVQALDNFLKLVDKLPSQETSFGNFGVGTAVGGAATGYGAFRFLAALGGGSGRLGRTAANEAEGIAARSGAANFGRGVARINPFSATPADLRGDAEETASRTRNTAATDVNTSAQNQETVAIDRTTLSLNALIQASEAAAIAAADRAGVDAASGAASAERGAVDQRATIADAERVAADEAAARASIARAGADAVGGAARAGGSAAASVVGLGTRLGGYALLAAIAAGFGLSVYNKSSEIGDTTRGAQAATIGTQYNTDVTALRAQAKTQDEAAAKAAAARGGFTGSIVNYLQGNDDSAIKNARAAADRTNELADDITKIRDKYGGEGITGSLDFSSTDALNNSFNALKNSGLSANEQMTALNTAMENLAKNGGKATTALTQVDREIAAKVGGKEATRLLADTAKGEDTAFDQANVTADGKPLYDLRTQLTPAERSRYGITDDDSVGSARLKMFNFFKGDQDVLNNVDGKGIDPANLSQVTTDTLGSYFESNPNFDPTDKKAVAALRERLSSVFDELVTNFPSLKPETKRKLLDGILGATIGSVPGTTDNASTATRISAFNNQVLPTAAAAGKDVTDLLSGGSQYGFYATGTADEDKKKIDAATKALADAKRDRVNTERGANRGRKGSINRLEAGTDDKAVAAAQARLDAANSDFNRDKAGYSTDVFTDPELEGAKKTLADATKGAQAVLKDPKASYQEKKATLARLAALQADVNKKTQAAAQTNIAIAQDAFDINDKVSREQVDLYLSVLAAAKLTGRDKAIADAANNQKRAQLLGDQASQAASGISVGTTRVGPNGLTETGTFDYNPLDDRENARRTYQGDAFQLFTLANRERSAKGFTGKFSETYNQLYQKVEGERQTTVQNDIDFANATDQANADPRSALDTALNQIRAANRILARYPKDSVQYKQAQAQYKQGLLAAADAQIDIAKNTFLIGRDQTDPVVQAAAEAKAAADKLAKDQATGATPDVIVADQLQKNSTQQSLQKAAEDQFLSDTQTNYDLHRIGFSQYLSTLQARRQLLAHERDGLQKNSEGYRQLTDELNEYDKKILDATNSLQGQFNLGDIKIPTVYEVRRQVATAQAGTGFNDNRVTSITINGIGSTQEVVQIVKQQLGTTAVVNRAPATNRKA